MSGCCSYAPKRRVYQLRAKLLSIDLHAGLSNWPSQSPKARLALIRSTKPRSLGASTVRRKISIIPKR